MDCFPVEGKAARVYRLPKRMTIPRERLAFSCVRPRNFVIKYSPSTRKAVLRLRAISKPPPGAIANLEAFAEIPR